MRVKIMIIKRQQSLSSIAESLALYSNNIALQNGAGLFDSNKSAEDLFIKILNITYDLSLINLNTEKNNYPAIDLGDPNKRVSYQVTSESSTTKLKTTITKFKEHNLLKKYDELVFLILVNNVDRNPRDIDIKLKVIDLKTIMRDIGNLSEEKIYIIDQYLKENIIYSNSPANNFIMPTVPQVDTNSINAESLINLLNFKGSDDLHRYLIKDLEALLFKLSYLTYEQRQILYYLVWRSKFSVNSAGYEEEDIIYMPSLELEQNIPGSDSYAKILINEGLVSYNDEYIPYGVEYEVGVLEAHFYGELEINLLSRIKRLCGNDIDKLSSVLIDCNFTNL